MFTRDKIIFTRDEVKFARDKGIFARDINFVRDKRDVHKNATSMATVK